MERISFHSPIEDSDSDSEDTDESVEEPVFFDFSEPGLLLDLDLLDFKLCHPQLFKKPKQKTLGFLDFNGNKSLFMHFHDPRLLALFAKKNPFQALEGNAESASIAP
ncbi:MAG: hypothetical protein Q7K34_04340 [archaeon]|nr:hypothetical protein [archaeon]